jgi:Meckel syndrome type 1 protein
MSEMPPSRDESEDVDDHYRRVSALDPSRPSEPVRRAVLDHAARLAEERMANAERTANKAPGGIGSTRSARQRTWRRPAAFGTLAAAMLAGVLIAPQFLAPRAPPKSASAPAQVSQPKAAATPAVPAEKKEQPPRSAADERAREPRLGRAPAPAPALGRAPAPALGRAPSPSPASPEVQGNSAPASDSAAELAAKNAPTTVESMAKARSGAAASSDSEADAARRSQTITSSVNGMLAAPRAAAPAPQELAAELRRAAEVGDVTTVQSLLGKQPVGKQPVIDAPDAVGRTALMLAALHGQAAAVDALLASGADPNAADARGMTPLQAAVAGNQPAIVAALQRAGAR